MKTRPGTRNDAGAISELLVALSERHIVVAFGEEGRSNLLGSMTPVAIEGFFDAGFRYHLGFDGEQLVGVVGTRDDQHTPGRSGASPATRAWPRATIQAGSP
jgi:hypothetical protein